MPYRPYRSERRHRLRRWLLIALSVAVAVTLIALLVSRDTDQRTSSEFYAAADDAARLHSEAADELEGTLSAIGVASRPDFEARLERLTEKVAEAEALLDVAVVPTVAEMYGAISTASSLWASGIDDLTESMAAILEGTAGDNASFRIRDAMDKLRSGDAAYAMFLELVSDPDVDTGSASFEPVNYVRPDAQDPLLYDPLTITIRLVSAYSLAPHDDVAVLGQFDPEPVGDRAGVPLLPFTTSVTLNAIVTNAGNEDASTVTVELTILNADTNETETVTQTVADLPAGGSTTVPFADLVLNPGDLYQMKLVVGIPEDSRPEDNEWIMTVIQNEE